MCSLGAVLPYIFSLERILKAGQVVKNPNNSSSPELWRHGPRGDSTETSRYAYAFLLAGCDPDQPSYRGFLFNIIKTTHLILNSFQSVADVIVMIRLSPESPHTTLTPTEEAWLSAVGAKLLYLPPPLANETFQQLQLLKFHVLQQVQYRCILYLDSDVMPICNLDYIFELSESGVTRPNLVVAWTKEPANGGFFMLEPKHGAYERIMDVVEKQKATAVNLPLPHFDETIGWVGR